MQEKAQKLSKADLERSLLDMLGAARKLIHTRKSDPLRAGTYNNFRQAFRQYEMRIRRIAAKGKIANLDKIAGEVVETIGELCKSLIRYILAFLLEGKNRGLSSDEYRANFKNVESCS